MSTTTGWPPGLLQDDCKKLSQWFASRINARHVVRQVCSEIRQKRMEKEMSDKQPETQGYGIWDMNIDGQRIMGFTPKQWFDREEQQQSAIERKDALLRQALETLCCETSENMDDPGHRCGHCDDYVDRNGTLRSAIKQELSQ